jgi:hypothetical protein
MASTNPQIIHNEHFVVIKNNAELSCTEINLPAIHALIGVDRKSGLDRIMGSVETPYSPHSRINYDLESVHWP